jgi:hypothetical protein
MKMRPVGLALLGALVWWAAAPTPLSAASCDPLWVKHVTKALDQPGIRPEAIRWMELFQKETDDVVSRGMLKSVQAKPLQEFLVTFKNLGVDDLPFPGATVEERVREAYRSIGNLTGPDFVPVTGLDGKIGSIVSDSRSNQMGALLDVKVADDIGLVGKRPLPDGTGFERTKVLTNSNGDVIAQRQYDIVDPAPGSPFGGVCHESKNWPGGWTDQKSIDDFMDEFRRDILLHAETDFAYYRLNLREATRPNLATLKGLLDQQFASGRVTENLDPDTILRVKNALTSRWHDGPGGMLHLY